jgi:anti-sigma factor RsiW
LHDRFERHIAHCAGCQAYLAQMHATIRTTGTLSVESLSPDAERTLLDAFRGWRQSAD